MAFNGDYLTSAGYIGGKAGQTLWLYTTTNASATIVGAGYFAGCGNGTQSGTKGMQVNDVVIVTRVTTLPNTTPLGITVYVVSAVDADGDCTVIATAIA